MQKLPIIVISCAATVCFACTTPEDHPFDQTFTEPPLPSRIVDLSPLVTEDLPLRIWGKKMLTRIHHIGPQDCLFESM